MLEPTHDGAAWTGRLVAEHFPKALQIVDTWYAREHIWKVARVVFVPGSPETSAWAVTLLEQAARLS